ncbi:universal stress protein [Maribacter sp. 2307ULW6-5]|uniref:universal stress protein n=1 Tax=Maribacter sp. 2307ULW6-5 TaxID=3386275 RepID=UPI0039BC5BAE
MTLLEKIVLATDFSADAKQLEETALILAKTFKAEVVPVHVLPNDLVNHDVREHVVDMAQDKLAEISERTTLAGVRAGTPLLEFGAPHDGVVKAAAKINANLIVTGSGEGLQHTDPHLGTTTERIIQQSEKPVFVMKAGTSLSVKHILCPVDFSKASERALANALALTRRFTSALTILSVCESQAASWFGTERDREEENKSRLAQHERKFDDFLSKFNLTDVAWSKKSPVGRPAEEILKTIAKKEIDLLVMGTHGRSGLNRLIMGSVTEKVIRTVPCSFMTLKSEDMIKLQLNHDLDDIEKLHETALTLIKDGFYEEAIGQLETCIAINNMHVPAYFTIASIHDKMNRPEKAKKYRKMGNDIKDRMWYAKVEEEARKLRGS